MEAVSPTRPPSSRRRRGSSRCSSGPTITPRRLAAPARAAGAEGGRREPVRLCVWAAAAPHGAARCARRCGAAA
eukprot:788500-Prymnesium_polylepis.1